jgi:hypothetical protein
MLNIVYAWPVVLPDDRLIGDMVFYRRVSGAMPAITIPP